MALLLWRQYYQNQRAECQAVDNPAQPDCDPDFGNSSFQSIVRGCAIQATLQNADNDIKKIPTRTMYYPFLSYNMLQQGLAVYFTIVDNPTLQLKQQHETTVPAQEVPVFSSKEQAGGVGISGSQGCPAEPAQALSTTVDAKADKILPFQIPEDEDSEFNPKRERDLKRKKKAKAKENQNRNVIPNLVHQIFSFIFKGKKSAKIVQEAFRMLEGPGVATFSRFYLYQARVKEAMNHYVNQSSLSVFCQYADPDFAVYSKEEQDFYLKVSRVVARHFLRWLSPSVTLTSRRMSSNKKFEHLRTRRILMERLTHKGF